jgi:hypothetical protein
MLRTIDCRLPPWREHLAEYRAEDESGAQVRETGLLGSIPLIVLSHDPAGTTESFAKAMEETWTEAQQDLTRLSSNGSRVVAKGSGHNIHLDRLGRLENAFVPKNQHHWTLPPAERTAFHELC